MIDLGWVAAIGGAVLAIAILYGLLRNRRRTDADRQRTEEATRTLYARSDREDKVSDPDPAKF
jgi:hypothetical protein